MAANRGDQAIEFLTPKGTDRLPHTHGLNRNGVVKAQSAGNDIQPLAA